MQSISDLLHAERSCVHQNDLGQVVSLRFSGQVRSRSTHTVGYATWFSVTHDFAVIKYFVCLHDTVQRKRRQRVDDGTICKLETERDDVQHSRQRQ